MHKGTVNWPKNKEKQKKLRFFINFLQKILVVQEKVVPLHPQNRTREFSSKNILGYGVMVTLQILVLPFLVRVRVPQLKKRSLSSMLSDFCLYAFVGLLSAKRNPSLRLGFFVYALFSASIALIFSRIRFISSFSFCTLRFISSIRLLPFFELALRNPRLFS